MSSLCDNTCILRSQIPNHKLSPLSVITPKITQAQSQVMSPLCDKTCILRTPKSLCKGSIIYWLFLSCLPSLAGKVNKFPAWVFAQVTTPIGGCCSIPGLARLAFTDSLLLTLTNYPAILFPGVVHCYQKIPPSPDRIPVETSTDSAHDMRAGKGGVWKNLKHWMAPYKTQISPPIHFSSSVSSVSHYH